MDKTEREMPPAIDQLYDLFYSVDRFAHIFFDLSKEELKKYSDGNEKFFHLYTHEENMSPAEVVHSRISRAIEEVKLNKTNNIGPF